MAELALVALIIGLVALVAGAPSLGEFAVFLFYDPELSVVLAENTLKIENRGDKHLKVELEYVTSDAVDFRDSHPLVSVQDMHEVGTGGLQYRSREYNVPAGARLEPVSPFTALETGTLTITLYPRVHASEFTLPVFFGYIDLQQRTTVVAFDEAGVPAIKEVGESEVLEAPAATT